jgi:hypothetical protein
MATNMAYDARTYTSISVHAWYQGTTAVTKCIIQGPTAAVTLTTTPKTNWTTDPPVNFTGLAPGQSYSFKAYFYTSTDTLVEETSTFYFTTLEYSSTTVNINTTAIGETYLNIRAFYRGNTGVTYCVISCAGNGMTISAGGTTYEWTTDSVTFSGLNPGTSYTASVTFYNGSGYVASTSGTFTTLAPSDTTPPTVSNVNLTAIPVTNGYNVKMTWAAYDDVGIVKHWLYRSSPNTQNYVSVGYDVSGSAREFTFTTDADGNLFQSGKTYYFRVRAVDAAGNISTQDSGTKSIYISATRPQNWAWEYTIVSGGSVYSVVGKKVNIMRAAHWNDFTTRINQFRAYKGLSPYSFTQVTSSTSGSAVVSAINQAINAINDMLPVGSKMSTITASNKVAASIFINLRDKLNSIQ